MIADFLAQIQTLYADGATTEHSYRPALDGLISSLGPGIAALNEPKRIACGAPDFIIRQGGLVIGHLEAKDLGVGLRDLSGDNKAQQERYLAALPNLIYTNCLAWDFYRDGERVDFVTIAALTAAGKGIEPRPEQYARLETLLREFIARRPQTIATPHELARRMAGKANLIKDVLARAILEDNTGKNGESELHGQYIVFQKDLIHDITIGNFADIYAETIAYGMFAARLHDPAADSFSRRDALELLPKSNPFLRSLFGYIAGVNLDERIAWIIDDLARVFAVCDIKAVMQGFGEMTGKHDPFIHFYETFLTAYDPRRRKARGVWYTPESVVNFIVRSVDEVLQSRFNLPAGLADTSKVTIDWDTGQTDKKGKAVTLKKQVHRVQILDPAAGTGTFLAEVIKQIAPKVRKTAPAMWQEYIERQLIPRLHGFELLMASYAMCHTKLDMILTELGYQPTEPAPRLSVYLTNALEEGAPIERALPFARWLSREAEGANAIKRDIPIMCVIGNPPYSVSSQNQGAWITRLIEDYKHIDGKPIKEQNLRSLGDDYVKFIRFSQHLIEKTGEGVLGLITNHGYLDNPTFRGMRWQLLKTFDEIYVLDLHGNAKKKEKAPDGKPDKNVFNIMQGVAILIAVKTRPGRRAPAATRHGDLWGSCKEAKHKALFNGDLRGLTNKIEPKAPYFFFAPKKRKALKKYAAGFELADLMPEYSSGVKTHRDALVIAFTEAELRRRIERFLDPAKSDDEARREFFKDTGKARRYPLGDTRDWKLSEARQSLRGVDWKADILPIDYRPFDQRFILYRDEIVELRRHDVMRHTLGRDNLVLTTGRQGQVVGAMQWNLVFVQNRVTDVNIFYRGGGCVFPLYLHPNGEDLEQTRRVNFAPELHEKIRGLAKHRAHGAPDEVAVFDYIYGVLHTPSYRETYAEFLKVDFPRIPWPQTPAAFWSTAAKGARLRKLHLLDPAVVGETPHPFTGDGDNTVQTPRFAAGRIWVNNTQFFANAPEAAWHFYIGGYQPAQKWLKDRKGRALNWEDVAHYQRILKVLAETDRLMREMD